MKYVLTILLALLPGVVMMEGSIIYPPSGGSCEYKEPTTTKETKVLEQRYFNPHKKPVVHGRGPGHCTAMAAYLRAKEFNIDIREFWTGDAKHRIKRAKIQGFKTSDIPVAGSLMVMPGGGKRTGYGHVAYVETVDINNGVVTIIDMNYKRKYIATRRTEKISEAIGFIYPEKPLGN